MVHLSRIVVNRLFGTPLVTEMWPDAPALNEELKHTILARSRSHQGVKKSNIHGWQSDLDLHTWGGMPVSALGLFVQRQADAYTRNIGGDAVSHRWMAQMWANVSRNGASNQAHCHPGCFWAGVYYVDDGYGGSDDSDLSGEIAFVDPRYPMIQMANPDLRYRPPPDGPPDFAELWLRPRTGMLLLFPAWLTHAVRPYRGVGERISIAFNLSVRRLDRERDGHG